MTYEARLLLSCVRFVGGIAVVAILTATAVKGTVQPSSTSAKPPPAYTVTDLGPLPHVADDVSMRINGDGAVALWMPSGAFSVRAAVWTDNTLRGMGSPAGYATSVARAINDRGEIAGWVGSSSNPVDSSATMRAFVTTSGTTRLLRTLGGRDSRAYAINARGQVAGVADLADGSRHAFLETGGKMTDLGTLPGGAFSQAYSLNAAGHVVGIADSGGIRHAVLWRDGRIQDLGTLPGGGASCALAINANDQIAGYSSGADGYHAFLLTAGKMQDLGTLGDDPSGANDLNDRGDVVGASSITETSRHAFLWHDGRLYDLNKLIPPDSGWVLTAADGINHRGQIVCVGLHDHRQSAVLLTPSGPAASP